MVWYGMVWYGMAWCGTVQCGLVWCGICTKTDGKPPYLFSSVHRQLLINGGFKVVLHNALAIDDDHLCRAHTHTRTSGLLTHLGCTTQHRQMLLATLEKRGT